MNRPAELLGICLHFLLEFNRTGLNHSAKIKLHMVAFTSKLLCFPSAFIALNVFAYFLLMRELLLKRKNLFLINSAQLTTFLNLNK